MNRSEWDKLSRDERAELVSQLHGEYRSIRTVAALLCIGSTTAHEYLVLSRIPSELREKYALLSLKAFIRASRSENVERALESIEDS